jgi:hypothetical protein
LLQFINLFIRIYTHRIPTRTHVREEQKEITEMDINAEKRKLLNVLKKTKEGK